MGTKRRKNKVYGHKMEEKELKKLYSKYVMNRNFYRVVSNEYLPKIRKKGLTPEENPYDDFKGELRKFFLIIENLSRKVHTIHIKWAFENPVGTRVSRICRKDLRKNYIDLNPDRKHNSYYLRMKGGSMISNIKDLAKELLKNKSLLTKKNLEQIDKVLKFCDKKSKYKMSTIYIPRSSKYFEKAHFQHFSGGKYWPSPFGRYEHFKKVILREGLRKYKPYLDGEKLFYIRLLKRVPAKEIHKIS
tara:strand:+ start:74 stop:808 length:735 start_codon:yes stop_codon:yes gene_type:complete